MDHYKANFSGVEKPKSDANRTITLFLALYLLVLAFFILLVSISSTEDVKSKALMESLTSTFSSVLPPQMDLTAFNATTGDFLAADDFQRQVTGLFSTVIGVIKIEKVQPGRLMRIEIEGDALFETDSDVIRDSQTSFLDRLVSAMSARPPGLRYELEFVAPTPWSETQTLPKEQTLPVKRVSAFARTLLSRGVPPGAVTIGLKGSTATNLEIWFHIRAEEENRIRFEEHPLINPEKVVEVKEVAPPPPPVTLNGANPSVTLDMPVLLQPGVKVPRVEGQGDDDPADQPVPEIPQTVGE